MTTSKLTLTSDQQNKNLIIGSKKENANSLNLKTENLFNCKTNIAEDRKERRSAFAPYQKGRPITKKESEYHPSPTKKENTPKQHQLVNGQARNVNTLILKIDIAEKPSSTPLREDSSSFLAPAEKKTAKKRYVFIKNAQSQYVKLGSGTFGTVFLAKLTDTDRSTSKVAIKMFQQQYYTYASMEASIYRMIQGVRHSMRFIEAISLKNSHGGSDFGLVFPYLENKDIFETYLATRIRIKIDDLRAIAKQSLETLIDLSSKNIMHADIKPENLVYNERSKELVVLDFGSSFKSDDETYCNFGTCLYRAPEILLNIGKKDTIDLWSLGVTLFELYALDRLFTVKHPDSINDQLHAIVDRFGMPPSEWLASHVKDVTKPQFFIATDSLDKPYDFAEPASSAYSSSANKKSMTDQILQNGALRKDHPKDVQNFSDLLSKIMKYENRISLKDALEHPFLTEVNLA